MTSTTEQENEAKVQGEREGVEDGEAEVARIADEPE